MSAILEICVDSAAGLAAARAGGADRIELCSALTLGGLTPSAGLIAIARQQPLPCYAIIRPRGGDFAYDESEVAQMEREITQVAEADLAGVVFGATRDGALDSAVLERLIACAARYRLSTTLHRAIDVVRDPVAAIDVAVELGFDRVLSSGGAPTALEGRDTLRAMHARADGRIVVMVGSGISPGNVGALTAIGIREIHASCSEARTSEDAALARLGFAAPVTVTQAERVRALREAIDHNIRSC
ncbi:MAG TPA: copper homeostasis protein CutC [Sphingomonas sp.]|nr:copper homeostasis protein CutC [Sphingomonas sp.]